MKNIVHLLCRLLIVLFIFTGVLFQLNNFAMLSNILMIVTSVCIVLTVFYLKKGKVDLYLQWIDIVYILFIMLIFISTIINREVDMLYSLIKLSIYYLVLSLCVRNIPDILNPDFFFKAFLVIGYTILLLNLIIAPNFLNVHIYQGIFDNPNTYGMFVATILIVSLGFSIIHFIRKKYLIFIGSIIINIFLLYLMVISNSRTAFFSVLLSILFLLIHFMVHHFEWEKISFSKNTIFFTISFIIVVFFVNAIFKGSTLYNAIKFNIIGKFIRHKDNPLSGRLYIWNYYLSKSNFIGSNYYDIRSELGVSTHNSFVYIFARFGVLPSIAYIMFWIKSVLSLILNKGKKYTRDNCYPILFMSVILFIYMSFMEAINYSLSMYAAVYSVSILNINSGRKDRKIEIDIQKIFTDKRNTIV